MEKQKENAIKIEQLARLILVSAKDEDMDANIVAPLLVSQIINLAGEIIFPDKDG